VARYIKFPLAQAKCKAVLSKPPTKTYHLEHKIGVDLTVSSTLKKPSKNYTCFSLRRFGLFLIHLQSKNIAALGNASNSKPKDSVTQEITV